MHFTSNKLFIYNKLAYFYVKGNFINKTWNNFPNNQIDSIKKKDRAITKGTSIRLRPPNCTWKHLFKTYPS